MAAKAERGVPLSTLCPKFLHTNSTSHTWPFSAIAELIDNAYDPDVNAKNFWIDKTVVQEQDCLSFMDSGNGLDLETMHKMLSFGYSDKTAIKGVKPIGMYGNGFKSGAMRLGKDAIVFSKSKTTSCVGMLSQSYLKEIDAKQIVVPIVCFEQSQTSKFSVREKQQASLKDILTYSPFRTQEELLKEIKTISSSFPDSKTGTRIIIWNLRRTPTRTTEFDFLTDRYDIRIPSDVYEEMSESDHQPGRVPSHIPESCYSLRAYCSILYLKPRMQIIIRGQKVKSQLVAKSLAWVRKDVYKPTFLNNKPIRITFGYNTKSKDQYGVMMYHKNRLIKAYERVGCQIKANNKGVGVIGVIECGQFLEPTHNKQSFNETDQYRKTMTNLGIKLEEYWKEIRYRRQTEDPNNNIPLEDATKRPDQNWAQCDTCLNWRKLPDGIEVSKLPEKWFCHLNPDPAFRSCEKAEEREDSDDDQPAYHKTYKQQEKVLKQREEREERRRRMEKVQLERQCLAELAKQNQALKRQSEDLQRELQLRNTTANSPSNNTNTRKRVNMDSPRGGAATAKSILLTVSQAACSSPGLPVISSVCSLSPDLLSKKRTQPAPPPTTPKRPRVNGFHTGTSNTATSGDVGPQSSPSVSLNGDDNEDGNETDDDLFILETSSTPKPKKSNFDLTKVKTEKVQSDANVGMLLECSDDAVMETNDAETSCAASKAVGVPEPFASSTTQTEVFKLKKEEESQSQTEGEERAAQRTADLKEKEKKCEDVDVDVCDTKTHCMDSEEAGPSCSGAQDKDHAPAMYPSIVEVQEQQDQLLGLMQSTAEERDKFKDEVHQLTCQLHDMQSRLQELTQIKKECSHQASQTEDLGEEGCYKSLFEKAKQKVDELIKDKPAESKPSTAKVEENDMDEIVLQVDSLLRELDQRNKERDELHSQVNHLEEERAIMASECEELRLSLQQQKEDVQDRRVSPQGTNNSSVRTHAEDNGGTDSGSDASKSLLELRHNIGRILISYVPDLDLGQVNFECNVIDELLEQVLCNMDSIERVGLTYRSRSINKTS
ncbi:MORC family CW-type zinc finger protein 3a [Labrus mixtus]|uniref:MORC family CW-type zinc finger protein 3a n=1 Tax=Labrus mixtus TaxID=508554 RepID=UPI0029C05FC8|nr:MORC family CW-type zinc finger protein 3a [Labrus mixtus]